MAHAQVELSVFCSRKRYPHRTITIRPQLQYEALVAARAREQTPAYTALYAQRAGIEGTLARSIRRCRLRRSRYAGQAKVHLGHILTATAMNVLRISEWLANITPPKMRQSPFTRVMHASST